MFKVRRRGMVWYRSLFKKKKEGQYVKYWSTFFDRGVAMSQSEGAVTYSYL